MKLDELYVHDGTLWAVIEDPSARRMTLVADLPKDEWSDGYVRKRIIFHDVLNYSVHEGPDHGKRTMLDLQVIGAADIRQVVRLDTTSGYRVWEATAFDVQDDYAEDPIPGLRRPAEPGRSAAE